MSTPKSFYYDSADRPHPFIEEIKAVIEYRDLLFLFISRSIKSRYKRSSLGVLWTLMNPMATMIVFSLVFSRMWRFDVPSYPAYVLSGLIVWNFFSYSASTGMSDMVFQGDLLKRIYMPRSIFVLAATGTGFVNFIISLVPLILIGIILGVPLSWSWLFLPFAAIIIFLFLMGFGLFLTAGAVFFSDLIPMFTVVQQIWFYATPLFYPISIIPERYLWLFKLNPMYYMVEMIRVPFLGGTFPALNELLIALGWAVGALIAGWYVFTSKSNEYAYRA